MRQEHGAFAALRLGRLHALQLEVTSDDDYGTVLETYTFTVRHTADGGFGLEIRGGAGAKLLAVREDLGNLVGQVVQLCREMPVLPGKYCFT